jgi:hypothetical protein
MGCCKLKGGSSPALCFPCVLRLAWVSSVSVCKSERTAAVLLGEKFHPNESHATTCDGRLITSSAGGLSGVRAASFSAPDRTPVLALACLSQYNPGNRCALRHFHQGLLVPASPGSISWSWEAGQGYQAPWHSSPAPTTAWEKGGPNLVPLSWCPGLQARPSHPASYLSFAMPPG